MHRNNRKAKKKETISMYRDCATGQLQLALQYEFKVEADRIVNLINGVVNSIPVETLMAADGHNNRTGRWRMQEA
ncbi:hypothetical protein AABB42_06750 [Limosilactobacillus fermentum]|uniref:hypothetical protein n=1 Tax=Limosilactobacillus fermentum TaxID=1613 RepID=UPI0033621932